MQSSHISEFGIESQSEWLGLVGTHVRSGTFELTKGGLFIFNSNSFMLSFQNWGPGTKELQTGSTTGSPLVSTGRAAKRSPTLQAQRRRAVSVARDVLINYVDAGIVQRYTELINNPAADEVGWRCPPPTHHYPHTPQIYGARSSRRGDKWHGNDTRAVEALRRAGRWHPDATCQH